MKVIYGISKIKKFKRPVVALGVFDGVHRGHRYILKGTARKARRINGTSVVVTFSPHPQKEQSLYSLRHRLRLIAELGIDICIVIKFSAAFARISAENFIKDILVNKIGVNFIYVGKNFRFGKSAKGDSRLFDKFSSIYGYKLKVFEVIKSRRQPVSSTSIRKLINKGNLTAAEKLLSRPVAVFGTVIKGMSLAGRLGFPTANIDPHHEILPPSGVYAAEVTSNNKKFSGVCNIGKKLEVYIFGFNQNIYGEDLEIQFVRKIRNEKKFTTLGLLAEQIKKDIKHAKKILSRH